MSVVWPAFIVKQGKNSETPANAEIIRNADGLETPNAVHSVFKLPNTSPTPRVRRCPLCAGWSRNCASRSFNASSLRRLVGITSAISRPFKIQDRGLLKLNRTGNRPCVASVNSAMRPVFPRQRFWLFFHQRQPLI